MKERYLYESLPEDLRNGNHRPGAVEVSYHGTDLPSAWHTAVFTPPVPLNLACAWLEMHFGHADAARIILEYGDELTFRDGMFSARKSPETLSPAFDKYLGYRSVSTRTPYSEADCPAESRAVPFSEACWVPGTRILAGPALVPDIPGVEDRVRALLAFGLSMYFHAMPQNAPEDSIQRDMRVFTSIRGARERAGFKDSWEMTWHYLRPSGEPDEGLAKQLAEAMPEAGIMYLAADSAELQHRVSEFARAWASSRQAAPSPVGAETGGTAAPGPFTDAQARLGRYTYPERWRKSFDLPLYETIPGDVRESFEARLIDRARWWPRPSFAEGGRAIFRNATPLALAVAWLEPFRARAGISEVVAVDGHALRFETGRFREAYFDPKVCAHSPSGRSVSPLPPLVKVNENMLDHLSRPLPGSFWLEPCSILAGPHLRGREIDALLAFGVASVLVITDGSGQGDQVAAETETCIRDAGEKAARQGFRIAASRAALGTQDHAVAKAPEGLLESQSGALLDAIMAARPAAGTLYIAAEPQARRFLAWLMEKQYGEGNHARLDEEAEEAVLRAEGPTLWEGMTADR